jgi:hypothetical protein
MKNLNLHDSGEDTYLDILTEKYDKRISEIENDTALSETEKRIEIIRVRESFEAEKRDLMRSSF